MVLPIIMCAYSIVFSIVVQFIESYYDNDFMFMPIGIVILLVLLYLIYFGLTVTMIVFYALTVSRQINMAKAQNTHLQLKINQ